jgi:hypothetical protein
LQTHLLSWNLLYEPNFSGNNMANKKTRKTATTATTKATTAPAVAAPTMQGACAATVELIQQTLACKGTAWLSGPLMERLLGLLGYVVGCLHKCMSEQVAFSSTSTIEL